MSILNNTLWLMSEKIIRLIFGVVISGLMARQLGVDDFGKINYLLSFLIILISFSTLGFNRIIIRDIAKYKKISSRMKIFIVTSLKLRVIASVVILLAALLIVFGMDLDDKYLYFLVFISILFTPFDVLEQVFQGLGKFKYMSLSRTVSFILSSLIRLTLIYFDCPIIYFALCIALEYFFMAFFITISFFIGMKGNNINKSVFSSLMSKRLLSESWPEIIAGLGAILFMKSDQVMLYWIGSAKEVGIYAAASRISEAWYFVPMAVVSSTFPSLVRIKENRNKESYNNGIRSMMCLLFYLGLFIGLFVSVFGMHAIDLIYGESYSESSSVLSIHIWGGIFFCYGISSGSWLVIEKKLKYNLYRNIFGLAVNCILNFVLIPFYGAIGASIAMVFGMFSAYFLFDYLCYELKGISKIKRDSMSFFKFLKLFRLILNRKSIF